MPDVLEMAAGRCMLCGVERELRRLYRRRPEIVCCSTCGLVFALPRETPPAAQGYPEEYYRGGTYVDYLASRESIHLNARSALGEIESLVQGRRLLDVGCATGFFLEAARLRGWGVRGLESSAYASEYARRELGLPVLTASIDGPGIEVGRADVITLWDTIEHLDRPDVALRRACQALDGGGLLVVSTGDYESLLRRLSGHRWRLFEDRTHNFFFSARTLRRLLADAGLKVLRLRRRGKRVGLGMILHQFPLAFVRRLAPWAVRSRAWLYVNLWDVMTVYARPQGER